MAVPFGCSDDNSSNAIDGPVTPTVDGGAGSDANLTPVSATVTLNNAGEPTVCGSGGSGTMTVTVTGTGNDAVVTVTGSYSGLQPTVSSGHIHFGKPGDNGGVVLAFKSPASTTVNETFHASDYKSPTATPQPPADYATFIQMLEAGDNAYINIHTTPNCPGGEIRGEIPALQ